MPKKSIIKVKAIDKAGNERLVEYIPPVSMKQVSEEVNIKAIVFVSAMGAGALIILLVIILLIIIISKKIKRRNNYE